MKPIRREDLQAKLEEIQSVVNETTQAAKSAGVILAGVVVVVIVLAFLIGRRKGRKGSARVEVFRTG